MVKLISGCASAWRRIDSIQCACSVAALLRNLRRAGVLKYRSRISTTVPAGRASGVSSPSALMRQACLLLRAALVRLRRETLAMAARASPRKPMVATRSRSSSVVIFDVAWRVSARPSCPCSMPQPLSLMRIRRMPPSSRSMRMRVLPASMAFSRSSLSTEEGRSTTSPAAIWLIRWSGRARMIGCAGCVGCGLERLISGIIVGSAKIAGLVFDPQKWPRYGMACLVYRPCPASG